jgi:carboxymethylenebutenolidase
MAQTARVDSAGSEMELYDVGPGGEARGAVIVIQEAFGITDHIKDVCERFAKEGYRAVAPHLFHRSGDPVIGYDEMKNVMPHLGALTGEGLESDLAATVGYLEQQGFSAGRIGVVGFCMGGSVSFLAAARHTLGAAVSFYGGGIAAGRFGMAPLLELAPQLKAPWLGFFGDKDQSIPVEQVEQLRDAVEQASVDTDIVRYPDAEHGFHCDARDSYHEASAKDAWQRTLDWFDTHITT